MAELDARWLLSVDDIRKYLVIGSDTVYRWIEQHDLPAHRMARIGKFKKNAMIASGQAMRRKRVK